MDGVPGLLGELFVSRDVMSHVFELEAHMATAVITRREALSVNARHFVILMMI